MRKESGLVPEKSEEVLKLAQLGGKGLSLHTLGLATLLSTVVSFSHTIQMPCSEFDICIYEEGYYLGTRN